MTCKGPGIPWTCIHKTEVPKGNQRHDDLVMIWEDNKQLETRASKYFLPRTETISVPVSNSDQEANVKLYYPPDFDANRKYPLIVYVYGGPGFQVVDEQWSQYEYQTYLSGQGFIYALIDPKGSGFQVIIKYFLSLKGSSKQNTSLPTKNSCVISWEKSDD